MLFLEELAICLFARFSRPFSGGILMANWQVLGTANGKQAGPQNYSLPAWALGN
jgi:hypothetical protein